LKRVNNISDPRKLQVGQILTIPALGPLDIGPARTNLLPKGDTTGLKRINLTSVRAYRGKLLLPVSVPRLSSSFGWRSGRFHEGLDLSAPEGTKIFAAHDGTVVFESSSYGGYGRIVAIKGKNLLTVYAHCSKNRVSTGDTIERGDWIADVGQTGSASGPHLHFETRVRDQKGRYAAVDPLAFFLQGQEP
jgi:murein DD-endopeptidase MepM/ murein hydrolase activator NlpD